MIHPQERCRRLILKLESPPSFSQKKGTKMRTIMDNAFELGLPHLHPFSKPSEIIFQVESTPNNHVFTSWLRTLNVSGVAHGITPDMSKSG